MVSVHMRQQKKESVDLQELQQLSGDRTESMSTSYAHLHGLHSLRNFEQAYPDAFKANVKMPPAGHYADAEKEIGRVCVQLASPDFKYMSGETLTLEGGMGQRP